MTSKQLLNIAQMVADGQSIEQQCPYCGPNKIIVSGSGKLISCMAFTNYVRSARIDGRGCLLLHEKAQNRGCPFEKYDQLACHK